MLRSFNNDLRWFRDKWNTILEVLLFAFQRDFIINSCYPDKALLMVEAPLVMALLPQTKDELPKRPPF